ITVLLAHIRNENSGDRLEMRDVVDIGALKGIPAIAVHAPISEVELDDPAPQCFAPFVHCVVDVALWIKNHRGTTPGLSIRNEKVVDDQSAGLSGPGRRNGKQIAVRPNANRLAAFGVETDFQA